MLIAAYYANILIAIMAYKTPFQNWDKTTALKPHRTVIATLFLSLIKLLMVENKVFWYFWTLITFFV